MVDLNTRIPSDSGWVLQSAADINGSGHIVGAGTHNGQTRAFLLTPSETPEPDTSAPKVETVRPANSAKGVARGTNLGAAFSEQMDPTSITKSTFKIFRCPSATSTNCTTQITNGTLRKSTDGLSATLNPYGTSATKLSAKTKYKAVITTGAKDMAGNALDQDPTTTGNQQMAWYFTTGS